jgi:hypothetical protein
LIESAAVRRIGFYDSSHATGRGRVLIDSAFSISPVQSLAKEMLTADQASKYLPSSAEDAV